VVEDLGNGISLEMVEIPGGEFWMGAPEGWVMGLD
jgi:formylglycine-generating enzyme required for sulfatase activity